MTKAEVVAINLSTLIILISYILSMTKAEVVAIYLSPLIITISHILSIHILIHYNTTLTCFNTTNLSPEFDYLVLYGSNSSTVLPRKDSMVTQCWSNVGPPSKT